MFDVLQQNLIFFRNGSIISYLELIIPDAGNKASYENLWMTLFNTGNPLVSQDVLNQWPYNDFPNIPVSGSYELIG